MFKILRFITRDFPNDTLKIPVRDILYRKKYEQIRFYHEGTKRIFEGMKGGKEYPRMIFIRGNTPPYYKLEWNFYNQDITSYDDTELLYLSRRSSDENIKQLLGLQDPDYKTILDTIQEYKDNLI